MKLSQWKTQHYVGCSQKKLIHKSFHSIEGTAQSSVGTGYHMLDEPAFIAHHINQRRLSEADAQATGLKHRVGNAMHLGQRVAT